MNPEPFAESIRKLSNLLIEAELTTKAREGLTKKEFAFPRLEKLPIHDKSHVQNAMARFNQTRGWTSKEKATAWAKVYSKAKAYGMDLEDFLKLKP